VFSLATLLGGAAVFLLIFAIRRWLSRRASAAAAELASDLGPSEKVFALYLVARAAQVLVPNADAEVAHGLHFAARLLGLIGLIRVGETLFFFGAARFRKRTAPRIVRSLVGWMATFLVSAILLRYEYKVDLSSVFATSALLSVVLGFALQDSLGNLFAGLTLNAEHPFEPGEWISFAGHTGRVVDVGWRSTRLVTSDEDELLVPNSLLSREAVVNHTRPQLMHANDLLISIDLDTSPARAKSVLLEAVQSAKNVLSQPPPRVLLHEFTRDGATYRISFHTQSYLVRRLALDEVQEAIWYALRRAGIDMPYPQTTLSFRERAAEADERRRKEHQAEAEDLFGRVDFVQAMSDEARHVLTERAKFVEYGPGQAIVRQGEQGETLYLVARGEVAVQVAVESGPPKEVARLGRGALFGEMSVLTGDPRTATVLAVSDAALLQVDREVFERILSREPELAQKLAEVIAQRRLKLDAARAEQQAPAIATEASNLLSRIRNMFGFARRAAS
jgi:small-conductance mechanosensitive channel/CRP-like cAMP-binding protein